MKLLEKREDYVQCLQLFVDGMQAKEYSSNKEQVEKVFNWVENILYLLAAKKTAADPESSSREGAFRGRIMTDFIGLINMDAAKTFEVLDEHFENQHGEFIESINGHPKEQFKYLDAMLTAHHP